MLPMTNATSTEISDRHVVNNLRMGFTNAPAAALSIIAVGVGQTHACREEQRQQELRWGEMERSHGPREHSRPISVAVSKPGRGSHGIHLPGCVDALEEAAEEPREEAALVEVRRYPPSYARRAPWRNACTTCAG